MTTKEEKEEMQTLLKTIGEGLFLNTIALSKDLKIFTLEETMKSGYANRALENLSLMLEKIETKNY